MPDKRIIPDILDAYGIDTTESTVQPLTSGLINNTWKVTHEGREFILQRINDHVFENPLDIAANIHLIDEYLKKYSPSYLFVSPVRNLRDEDVYFEEGEGYFRVFPFIAGSHTINTATTAHQAFEAALQFGKFTRLLCGFDARQLRITIPDFHNLSLRYSQFDAALKQGDPARLKQSAHLISEIKRYAHIVDSFEKIRTSNRVRQRVTHHDTKISNVLFDDGGKGLCVIDLDTVMPGYFISDVGDMMRTYLSPANEEEKDFSKIDVREDFFKAIVNGYLSSMGDELTTEEQGQILYAGLFMIYMQAIRFLTDHLQRDVYYGARYEDHNFVRAGNQLILLKHLGEKASLLQDIIAKELQTRSHFIF